MTTNVHITISENIFQGYIVVEVLSSKYLSFWAIFTITYKSGTKLVIYDMVRSPKSRIYRLLPHDGLILGYIVMLSSDIVGSFNTTLTAP